jgi:hypothetical protein
VFVVFVRNLYTTERNFYLSDAWLEQGARKQSGGFTRFPVCAEGSWEGDYYGEVRPLPHDPVVTKLAAAVAARQGGGAPQTAAPRSRSGGALGRRVHLSPSN